METGIGLLVVLLGMALSAIALEVANVSAASVNDKPKAAKVKPKRKGKKGTRANPIRGEKSARDFAIEHLKKHGGKSKFADLMKAVEEGMGRALSWTPTYYLKSPGFSKPERGIVAYSAKVEAKVRKEASATKEAAKQKAAAKVEAAKAKKPKKKAPEPEATE